MVREKLGGSQRVVGEVVQKDKCFDVLCYTLYSLVVHFIALITTNDPSP